MPDSGITEKPHETSAVLPAQLPIQELNGFELITKVGQGGNGTVFKARQKSLDRLVALKILLPSVAKNKRFIERFQREARASAKLWHPHIVQGIDVGQDAASGLWYFAMEFVNGPSLRAVLKKEKILPEKRALEILAQVALALQCVAEAGMIHRDIKPDNILLNERGIAKLADLGLAKELSNESAELTQSGQALGTPNYMAPEQVRGEDDVDIRADLYALGATLFHLVTGQAPFKGGTSAEILSKHLVEAPPLAHKVNPDVSEACSKLISKLMEKKREDRVQNPQELTERIAVLLNPESGKTGQRQAAGSKTASGMRPGVNARSSGPRPAVGNRASGGRPGVERASTALQMPINSSSTGPLNAVDGGRKPTTGPRVPIHVRTTGNLNPVEGEVRVIDITPSRPVARKSGGISWLCVGAFAVIVGVAAGLVLTQKHDEPAKTVPAEHVSVMEKTPVSQPIQPTQPVQTVDKKAEQRQMKARAALDNALSMQINRPDDFPALLPAFNEACELNRDSAAGTKASEALAAIEKRWSDNFSVTLKVATESALASTAKGEFAAAADALKDDVIPANLRIKDWAQQLEARLAPVRDAAEAAATKILDDARTLAQGGDEAGLQNAIEKAKLAEKIPAAFAPSAAKAAQVREGWIAELAALKKKDAHARKTRIEQAKELAAGVHKDISPLCQQNHFSAAAELLEKKLHDPALAAAADILQTEKADLAAIVALRQRAIDALRATKGKAVTVKKGKGTLSGTISAEQTLPGVTLTLGDGPEITVAPDQMEVSDIDAFAPVQDGAEKTEDSRRRGLLYLYTGDAHKAREFFKALKPDEVAAYLERLDILDLGEVEVRARKDFAEAETLFSAKKYKEAQLAYLAFTLSYAKTKFMASVSAQLKERVDAVEHILNPYAPGLSGSYYKGSAFADAPLLTRIDKDINFDWTERGPANEVGHDNYCVRWEGVIKITKPGHYTFATLADDGARLWINGKQLVDHWKFEGSTHQQGQIDLSEGQCEIKLEYFQGGGGAFCKLHWALQGGFKEELIPADALMHSSKK